MKKLLVIISAIVSLTVFVYNSGFGLLDLKKQACQKACDEAYDQCVDKGLTPAFQACMKKANQIKDEKEKKKAQDGCKKDKDAAKKGKESKDLGIAANAPAAKSACQPAKDKCNAKCN